MWVSVQPGPVQLSMGSTQETEEKIHTECCWNTDYDGITGSNLLRKVDLCVWRTLEEGNVWDAISRLDHICDLVVVGVVKMDG